MTEQEKKYFEILVNRREIRAETINDPEFKSGFESTIDKYTDQAHFVYELLQNADDSEATYARFVLEDKRLIFAHNGKKRFFVSNPDTVEKDRKNGVYGSVNSITAIGYSNKLEENAIGKFGVGFMSVFQYTNTPMIYDANICFQIENLIIPRLIEDDTPLRYPCETLFIFPFNLLEGKYTADKAYSDIAEKPRTLSHPLMFLNTLKQITYQIGSRSGIYKKDEIDSEPLDSAIAQRFCFTVDRTQDNSDDLIKEDFWFFSRGSKNTDRYFACFALENEKLAKFDSPAFCFFSTKEKTGLHFAIHAPFLLTDNREGIKAGEPHNQRMIELLSELAADSLVYLRDIGLKRGTRLIDDNILDIIPTNEEDFHVTNSMDSVSFMPFFTAIREKMSIEELLPTVNGYVSKENAYWADTQAIAKLFSQEQLALLTDNIKAQWVFITKGRDRGRSQFARYIDYITNGKWCDHNALINGRSTIILGISASFIERQTIEWLKELYRWLAPNYKLVLKKPVFINRIGQAVAAFDNNNQHILFIDGIDDAESVSELLLDNDESKGLLQQVGVGEASLWDHIYKHIITTYLQHEKCDIASYDNFKLYFRYYLECKGRGVEPKDMIKYLQDFPCLNYYTASGESGSSMPSFLYFPDAELQEYFGAKPDSRFLAWNEYAMLTQEKQEDLREFFMLLGVNSSPRIIKKEYSGERESVVGGVRITYNTAKEHGWPKKYSTGGHHWSYCELDGLNEVMGAICNNNSIELSILLWHVLLELANRGKLEKLFSGEYTYKYYSKRAEAFLPPAAKLLRTGKWLVDTNRFFHCPNELSVNTLNDCYKFSDDIIEIVQFLQIKDDTPVEENAGDNLTDEQREDIELGRIARKLGYTPDEAKAILERERQKKTAPSEHDPQSEYNAAPTGEDTDTDADADRAFRKLYEKQSPARKSVIRNIMRDRPEKADVLEGEEETESDEYTPPAINFQKRIQRAEEKSRMEVDKIAREQELSDQLSSAPKYSYAWFRALMELEALSRSENESGSREISISFGRVELDPGTERTLLLKQPSRYIPHWMEDLADDTRLTLQPKGQQECDVKIEVVSVKGYTLHTRLLNAEAIKGIDLSGATASISIRDPGFLLESLQNGFASLNLPDDYDLKAHLSNNFKFVFGPPGTGKTTYLAREELIPLMQGAEDEKVLVLAPTNKAADVLAMRIMELMGKDSSYKDWLVRFGTTFDEKIEQSEIYRDRSFYLPKLRRCVLVTTIARFPYDSIGGKALREMNWDRVVIDEASMIPIANIIYPLYQCNPKQFIIAGDPLQIQPVAQVEQDENIYKMVGLKSFTAPRTEPHDYEVKLLTTQYRSVPSVGEVFSRFAYGGVLKHARSEDSRRQMNIDDVLNVAPLNIIKFPVSQYEGIFRAKKLGGSPYQVYSALFAYEFSIFLAGKIGVANPSDAYSIGVISPYRAQADLISRLLARAELPANVSVQAGTIHGFQGDECDTIIAVFNPPQEITADKTKAETINKWHVNKLNIINVSISRARDCLFVLMPDAETEHIERLKLVNKVERLIKSSEEYQEYNADEIEELMFGRTGYLEENTFSTSHQNVNVYGLPEKRYEVRSEDTAIDVQIHEGVVDC